MFLTHKLAATTSLMALAFTFASVDPAFANKTEPQQSDTGAQTAHATCRSDDNDSDNKSAEAPEKRAPRRATASASSDPAPASSDPIQGVLNTPELFNNIIQFLPLSDLQALSCTSATMRKAIQENSQAAAERWKQLPTQLADKFYPILNDQGKPVLDKKTNNPLRFSQQSDEFKRQYLKTHPENPGVRFALNQAALFIAFYREFPPTHPAHFSIEEVTQLFQADPLFYAHAWDAVTTNGTDRSPRKQLALMNAAHLFFGDSLNQEIFDLFKSFRSDQIDAIATGTRATNVRPSHFKEDIKKHLTSGTLTPLQVRVLGAKVGTYACSSKTLPHDLEATKADFEGGFDAGLWPWSAIPEEENPLYSLYRDLSQLTAPQIGTFFKTIPWLFFGGIDLKERSLLLQSFVGTSLEQLPSLERILPRLIHKDMFTPERIAIMTTLKACSPEKIDALNDVLDLTSQYHMDAMGLYNIFNALALFDINPLLALKDLLPLMFSNKNTNVWGPEQTVAVLTALRPYTPETLTALKEAFSLMTRENIIPYEVLNYIQAFTALPISVFKEILPLVIEGVSVDEGVEIATALRDCPLKKMEVLREVLPHVVQKDAGARRPYQRNRAGVVNALTKFGVVELRILARILPHVIHEKMDDNEKTRLIAAFQGFTPEQLSAFETILPHMLTAINASRGEYRCMLIKHFQPLPLQAITKLNLHANVLARCSSADSLLCFMPALLKLDDAQTAASVPVFRRIMGDSRSDMTVFYNSLSDFQSLRPEQISAFDHENLTSMCASLSTLPIAALREATPDNISAILKISPALCTALDRIDFYEIIEALAPLPATSTAHIGEKVHGLPPQHPRNIFAIKEFIVTEKELQTTASSSGAGSSDMR